MTRVTFGWEGFEEFDELLDQITMEFGVKDTRRILTRSVRQAMQPVLWDAKINSPVDTGALQASLQVEARKPTRKDQRSKYVDRQDTVIATVTTASGKKLAKRKFHNVRTGKMQKGITSDGRAMAAEFGTAKEAARPFLRPALESNQQTVVNSLGDFLKDELEKYKARKARKAARAIAAYQKTLG